MTSRRVHEFEAQLRFRDLNVAGHVDNLAAVRLVDEARMNFLRHTPVEVDGAVRTSVLAGLPAGVGELVAALTVDFRSEMEFAADRPYVCRTWVSRIGASSVDLCSELRTAPDREPSVVVLATAVLRDGRTGQAWLLSDEVRRCLELFLGAQAALRPRA